MFPENLAFSDKDYNGANFDFLSREDRFMDGVRKEALFMQKTKELDLSSDEIRIYEMYDSNDSQPEDNF